MAKKNTSPTALLDENMQTMYDLLGQLIGSGLTPTEARNVLHAMVSRVLAIHPATAPALDANE